MSRQTAKVVDGPGTQIDLVARVPQANLRQIKTGATTLVAADSGALCLFNTAAGYTFTLPVPVPGLWFRFVVDTTITSSNAKVITDSASTFLKGNFVQASDSPTLNVNRAADGTTIRSWVGNGTTTGGITGDWFEVVAISSTVWEIYGMGNATGTEATPFATS